MCVADLRSVADMRGLATGRCPRQISGVLGIVYKEHKLKLKFKFKLKLYLFPACRICDLVRSTAIIA